MICATRLPLSCTGIRLFNCRRRLRKNDAKRECRNLSQRPKACNDTESGPAAIARLQAGKTLHLSKIHTKRNGLLKQSFVVVKKWISEILNWCHLVLPMALFACVGLLFRESLVDASQLSALHHQHAAYASISKPISQTKFTWGDVINYKFQQVAFSLIGCTMTVSAQVMSMRMFGKLCAVFVAAIPIVAIGGLSYKIVTGDRLRTSLFKAYSIMGDVPGADAVEVDNALALFIANLIFFAGMFTVAVTLGIVCDDISNFVSHVRHGNYQVVEKRHCVILNVNPLLGPVLRQISEASKERGSFKCPIVVLADVDKDELEERVSQDSEGLGLRIFTRKGCTHDPMDLKRVAAATAKYVIWLEPEEDEISVAARRACAIASLKALGAGHDETAKMVVQTSHDSMKSAFQLTDVPLAFRTPPPKERRRLDVIEMYEEENFDRLLAQSALQPGLSAIISDVLQHNIGPEFYVSHAHDFGGELYSTARRHFDSAAVCGVFTPGADPQFDHGEVILNPPDDTVLRKEDRLVLLCNSEKQAVAKAEPLPSSGIWVNDVQREHVACQSENVVVLCFGEESYTDSGLVDSIAMFAPKGTNVTIVAKSYPDMSKSKGQCSVRYVEGNPASFNTLLKLSKQKIDSIVLAGLEDLPPKLADAQLISSLIQIQEAASTKWKDKTGFTVVSPLNFTETKQVADHLISEGKSLPVPISLDVLLPAELASGILVQVTGAPVLDVIFKDLMSEPGSEIFIRHAAEFGLVGKGPIKTYEVADILRRHGETFLGILKEDKSCVMAPHGMSEYAYTEGDKIVVLASSFEPENAAEK